MATLESVGGPSKEAEKIDMRKLVVEIGTEGPAALPWCRGITLNPYLSSVLRRQAISALRSGEATKRGWTPLGQARH